MDYKTLVEEYKKMKIDESKINEEMKITENRKNLRIERLNEELEELKQERGEKDSLVISEGKRLDETSEFYDQFLKEYDESLKNGKEELENIKTQREADKDEKIKIVTMEKVRIEDEMDKVKRQIKRTNLDLEDYYAKLAEDTKNKVERTAEENSEWQKMHAKLNELQDKYKKLEDEHKECEKFLEEIKPKIEKKLEEEKPEEKKPEEKKPEEKKPEERKSEEKKPEERTSEEEKTGENPVSHGFIKIGNVEKVYISPDNIRIIGTDNLGNLTQKQIELSDDKVDEILESFNFKEGTEEYDRVDPNIVKALSNNSRQLIAYLKACNLKDDNERIGNLLELSEELPEFHYDLTGIRKEESLNFEEKDYIYKQAKKTNKMFKEIEDMCTLKVGLLDRLYLLAGRTINKVKFLNMSLKNRLLNQKEKPKMLENINNNLNNKHSEFTQTLRTPTMPEPQKTSIDELTPEQKAILENEAQKMGFTQSDGDVRDDF